MAHRNVMNILLCMLILSFKGYAFTSIPTQTRVLKTRAVPHLSSTPSSITPAPPLPTSYDAAFRSTSVKLPKVGRINLYGLYYGLTSIYLGIIWSFYNFITWTSYFVLNRVLRLNVDPDRRVPVFLAHVWGISLLRFTRCFPTIKLLPGAIPPASLFSSPLPSPPLMYVANHCSWMDIPYLGAAIGWRNYKIVAKKELTKVPILGQSMKLSKHILIDRSNRRSQILTLRQGITTLEKNIPLCTFPEGTRSRTGRLMPFKRGSFKMAVESGASIVPLSIIGAEKVMPINWAMPMRPSTSINATIVVGAPITSVGKTEKELTAEVRMAMIQVLPESQKPL